MSGASNTLEISGKNYSQQVTSPRLLSAAVKSAASVCTAKTACSRKGVADMLRQQEKWEGLI